MNKQAQTDDWMTDTCVIRFQAAQAQAMERFAEHFVKVASPTPRRDLLTEVL